MKKIFLMSLLFIATHFLTAQTATAPAGTGTSGDPYQITSLDNLYWIADQVNNVHNLFSGKYFKQMNDIDASPTSGWFDNGSGGFYGWLPIGNADYMFNGKYNGDGFKIDGLYIHRPANRNIGLFGYIYSATINDLGITNVDIEGNGTTGALVGYSWGSNTFTNCYSTGSIVGGSDQIFGGLIGINSSSDIKRCYSTVSISTSSGYAGGLIGRNQQGEVSDCYATGSVSGTSISQVGGLVGYNNNAGANIINSYSTGAVSSGYVDDVGGLVGRTANGATVTNSFWDTQTSNQNTSAGGTGKTTLEMKAVATFTNTSTSAGLTNAWDFVSNPNNDVGNNDYWDIRSAYNNGYPFLSWQSFAASVTTQSVTSITASTATGNGNVTALGYPNPTQHGVCWNTGGSPTIADNKTEDGAVSTTGAFTSTITGLSQNTKYYVRAYATNSAGTAYGEELNFTTFGVPLLTTNEIDGVNVTAAICGGNITEEHGYEVTARGVCWSSSQNPTIANAHTTDGSGIGAFESNITGLSKNTRYYARAYATNSAGTAYGEEKNFITPNQLYNMLDFDGADDYTTTPITLPNQGTIEFWFYADDINTGYLWTTTANNWYTQLTSGIMYVWIGGTTGGEALTKSLLTANTWYHCAITWLKAGISVTVQLFINGTLADFTAISNSWGEPGSVLTLGKKTTYFNGKLDEFRIWNTVKTESEIRENMHKFISPSSDNLMCYYNFDLSSGSTATDGTSGGYNGTLLNMSNTNWLTSTAPIGVYGSSVRTTTQTSVGQTGKTISAAITSGGDNTNYLGISTYGDGDASIDYETFPDGITQRTNLIWGVKEFGSCTADIVFDYSSIVGATTNESALKLMKRSNASSAWTNVTGSAVQSPDNHTFTMTGITTFSEFSIGDGGTNPLPVELSSFAAKAADNSVTLNWETATEVNNYGFEVERAANLRGLQNDNGDSNLGGFSFIGFVKGSGNSNSSKQYSFVDSNPSLGKIQYRLKQIDNDGSFKYSRVVEAELNFIPKEYSLSQNYPNPFNPTTVISYQLPVAGNVTLKIYDVLGREVATLVNEVQQAGKYNVQLSADNYHLSSGVYIYRINAGKFSEEKKMLLLK